MKRLMFIMLAIAMTSMVATAATNVVSVNVVGYGKAGLEPGARILRGMPFNNLAGSSNTLLSIFSTNRLAQNDNYALCDRIMLYLTAESRYQAVAQWTDGVFYLCNNLEEWNLSIPTNTIVEAGTSFWIVRAGGAVSTNELTFLGEVVSTATQQVNLVNGYQLVSYAFSSPMDIQSINTNGMAANDNYALSDRIVTWETNRYQFHALWTDGVWYLANDLDQWNLSIPSVRTLDMGEGFWFISQGAKPWVETNKYLGNL